MPDVYATVASSGEGYSFDQIFNPSRPATESATSMAVYDLYVNLPVELVSEIIAVWLNVKSVVALNSAYCNRAKRSVWLGRLSSPTVTLTECMHKHFAYNYVAWVTARNIRVSCLSVWYITDKLYQRYAEKHGQAIRMVVMWERTDYNLESLLALMRCCPGANTLVWNLPMETLQTMVKVSVRQPIMPASADGKIHLTTLVSNYRTTTSLLQSTSGTYLQSLCVDCGDEEDAEFMEALHQLVSRAPTLTKLSLLCDDPEKIASLYANISTLCPQIQYINLSEAEILWDDVQSIISNLKNLKGLNLSESDCTDEILQHFTDCYKDTLEELCIDRCEDISSSAFFHLLKQCTKLQRLYFDFGIARTLDNRDALISCNLAHVRIRCLPAYLEISLVDILGCLPNLETFGLHAKNTIGVDFSPLAGCVKLHTVYVYSTRSEKTSLVPELLGKIQRQVPRVSVEWCEGVMSYDFNASI